MALPLVLQPWVVYDLEFTGDIRNGVSDCHIWNLGAVKNDGSTFDAVIDVPADGLGKKAHPGCLNVTKTFLRDHGAVSFDIAFTRFKAWVGEHAVLVSHNNNKADKPVLERECDRHNVILPHWYFFDTLIYFRTKIQTQSYRLPDLYFYLTGKTYRGAHTALADALALRELLDFVKPAPGDGFMYPRHLTPLQNIKYVGSSIERALVQNGVRCVEHLVLKYMLWVQMDGCSRTLMRQFLTRFNLPVHDLTPIASELVENWLPRHYGGLSWARLL